MVGVSRVFRSSIDSFVDDLVELAKELAVQEVERALATRQKESRREEKLAAKLERAEARRQQKERSLAERATARIERAEERRRQREARRLSLGFSPSEPKRRASRSEPKNGAVPAAPPPLFVHKRKRDGQIQALTRPPEEGGEQAPAAAAAT